MLKYMVIILILVFFIEGSESYTYAETNFEVQSRDWSYYANRVLDLVKKTDYEEARIALRQLGDAFTKSNLAKKNLTVAGIHQLSLMVITLQESLSRITIDEKEILEAATRLALAFDAVSHSKQPQWKSYYNSLIEKVDSIQEAIKKGNKQDVSEVINAFNNEYRLLRPAIVVTKSPSTVNHLDSLVNFMGHATLKEVGSNLEELRELLKNIFYGTEKDVLVLFHPLKHLPIVIPIFWIIGFIVAILGIVSWRKHVSFTQR